MDTRTDIEQRILHILDRLERETQFELELLETPLMVDLVYIGQHLNQYYVNSGDATVNEEIIGRFFDVSIAINTLADKYLLEPFQQFRLEQLVEELEGVIHHITASVERNIHRQR